MNDTLVYTVRDGTKILHCSPNYVYKLIENGYLPAIKLRSIRILKSSLEKFLFENQGNDLSDPNNITKMEIGDYTDEQS